MGLFVGQIRKQQLIQEKAKLEWLMLNLTQAKSVATKSAMNLMQVGTDYEADSLVAKKLQERQYKLKVLEDKIDQQKNEVQERLDSITKEMESVDSMIKANIESSFSYKVS